MNKDESGVPPVVSSVSESIFAEAAKNCDASSLLEHLRGLAYSNAHAVDLAALVRRAGSLICERPDKKRQAKRDAFTSALRNFVISEWPQADISPFDEALGLIQLAEDGHHRILAFLSRCPFSRELPAVRAAAVIARMEANLAKLQVDSIEAMKGAGKLFMPGGVELRDDKGQLVSGDAILSGMVFSLGGTLLMEGYANDWFDNGDRLILPLLPPVDDRAISLAFQSEYLSVSWNGWIHMHESARYHDREIEIASDPEGTDHSPARVDKIYRIKGPVNAVDFIANERSVDRDNLSATDLTIGTNIGELVQGLGSVVPLGPAGWISKEEFFNSLSLSEALGYEIANDIERPGGLRLIQWVRGYMTLCAWTAAQAKAGHIGIFRIEHASLKAILASASLSEGEADTFLDAVSFRKRSRDLFDSPLVRTEGDWLLIGAALMAPRMAKIIPSMLAQMGVQLHRKGEAFEARVQAFLNEQGLDARKITFRRGDDEYDYDVLFPWDDYLFHFECKNHGLSGNNPVRAYRFIQELVGDVNQVTRQIDGLNKWPEILTEAFGPTILSKQRVHCILQNDTYQYPDEIDGVRVFDWSALGRFFQGGAFRLRVNGTLPDGSIAETAIELRKFWSGERPIAKDLYQAIVDAHQLKVQLQHLEVREHQFHLDETTVAIDLTQFRRPMSAESLAKASGASPEQVSQRVAEAVLELARIRDQQASKNRSTPDDC